MTAPARPVSLAELRQSGPTVNVENAARALGVSRSAAYEALARGEFPAKVIVCGSRLKVVTASLIGLLDEDRTAAEAPV